MPRVRQYQILNEASLYYPDLLGLQPGKTEVWYWKNEFMRGLILGLNIARREGVVPDPLNLSRTHVMLGRVLSADKQMLYSVLQGEIWSPQGEANTLIGSLGLGHTSMSVGDLLVIKGTVWFTDMTGFAGIGSVEGR